MQHIRVTIDREQALRVFAKGWRNRLRLSIRRPRRNSPRVPCSELIWMPCYLVSIDTHFRNTTAPVDCTIDGCSGSFAIFQMPETIEQGVVLGECFPPSLSEPEAEQLARAGLLGAILRRRSRAGKPIPEATRSLQLLAYPYWVYYHERRRGTLDIKVLDAATGQLTGNKIKLGILEAFQRAAGDNPE